VAALVFQNHPGVERGDLGSPVTGACRSPYPELDGAIEPIVLSGGDEATWQGTHLQDRVEADSPRVIPLGSLRTNRVPKKAGDHRVISFRPTRANGGHAAYLDVFGSITRVLEECKRAVLRHVQNLPAGSKGNDGAVINDPEPPGRTELADRPPTWREGVRGGSLPIRSGWKRLGQAPGNLTAMAPLLILSAHFGNILVGVQPLRYKAMPMRLLCFGAVQPHHGLPLFTYLE